jgi:hypothetical protein
MSLSDETAQDRQEVDIYLLRRTIQTLEANVIRLQTLERRMTAQLEQVRATREVGP